MTEYETEVDTVEATQEAGASEMSDIVLGAEIAPQVYGLPVLDRIRTCD